MDRLRAENERLREALFNANEALFNAHMAMLTWHRLDSEQRGKAILAVAIAGKQ